MIGGEAVAVAHLDPVFRTLAPGMAKAARTPGRSGEPSPAEHGYLHCGPSGAGHFTKMVHNGVEYGLMAAYAEGLNILKHAGIGSSDVMADAEIGPMQNPAAALFGRFDSRGRDEFANQVLSAMRKQFGGHEEKAEPR